MTNPIIKWSAERKAIVAKAWAEGWDEVAIRDIVNCWPGPQINGRGVAICAIKMGVRRPAWFVHAAKVRAGKAGNISMREAAKRAQMPAPEPVVVAAPIVVPATPLPKPVKPPIAPYAGTKAVTRAIANGRSFSMLGGKL